jgi:hypothetical protein
MAECKPAASSTTPTSSCEAILTAFQAEGRPGSQTNTQEGCVLGGFEIKTPKVGDGFIEWAIKGYDLEGKAPAAVTSPDYDKSGDWLFDKTAIQGGTTVSEDAITNSNYAKKGKK